MAGRGERGFYEGRTLQVINVPGAAGVAGVNEYALRHRPDGRTALVTDSSNFFPYLLGEPMVRYDCREFAPILASRGGEVVFVSPRLGVNAPAQLAAVFPAPSVGLGIARADLMEGEVVEQRDKSLVLSFFPPDLGMQTWPHGPRDTVAIWLAMIAALEQKQFSRPARPGWWPGWPWSAPSLSATCSGTGREEPPGPLWEVRPRCSCRDSRRARDDRFALANERCFPRGRGHRSGGLQTASFFSAAAAGPVRFSPAVSAAGAARTTTLSGRCMQMRIPCSWFGHTLLVLALLLAPLPLGAQAAGQGPATVPHPATVFGFQPGEDYKLADYTQLLDFYRQLTAASERVQMIEIGRTAQDNPLVLLFISTEENLRQLERWRSISERLPRAHDLPDAEARQLAREGKAIVWIDAGLHSTEVAHAQHAPLLAYHMVTDETEETRRIREDVILLLMPQMNPDGHDIVVNWYRQNLGTPYETTRPPNLYHEYVDHDINRDWFIPPFADPVNPNIPPLVVRGTNLVGDHMAKRFEAEGMSGVVARMGFDIWWNGGMRTAPYFHNMIGILSEVGHASATPAYHEPSELPETFGRGTQMISSRDPSVFYANPWPGGWARLGDAVQYHMVASLGTLDIASRLRKEWLYNIYQMGRDAVRAGEQGGPFAYVVPREQRDAGEAVELVNVLRRGGVEVHRATSSFVADGQRYPAGSYVAFAGQAFRAHLVDLMERQVYPDRRLYPDGPPEPPYDLAGWTLPFQMGVRVHRVEAPFRADVEAVEVAPPPPGRIAGNARWEYLLSPRSNASRTAANRLLEAGEVVSMADAAFSVGRQRYEAGTLVVQRGAETAGRVETLARELGLEFTGITAQPRVARRPLRAPRVGLYRFWVVNIDEGWMRWTLEQYGFPVRTLRDADIRGGDLSGLDVIILPAQPAGSLLQGHEPGSMPEEYVGGLGAEGVAALRRFVEGGGRLVAIDGSTDFAIEQLELPVRNVVQDIPA